MEKHGIDQLEKIVVIGVTLANAAGTALEDGKIGLGDLGVLLKLSAVAPIFAEVDFSKALPEITDLSAPELAKIQAAVNALELPNQGVESKVEVLFAAASKLYLSIKELLAVFKPA